MKLATRGANEFTRSRKCQCHERAVHVLETVSGFVVFDDVTPLNVTKARKNEFQVFICRDGIQLRTGRTEGTHYTPMTTKRNAVAKTNNALEAGLVSLGADRQVCDTHFAHKKNVFFWPDVGVGQITH